MYSAIYVVMAVMFSFSAAAGNGPPDAASDERRDREKEEKIENDDPDALNKARQWDDWKDGKTPAGNGSDRLRFMTWQDLDTLEM